MNIQILDLKKQNQILLKEFTIPEFFPQLSLRIFSIQVKLLRLFLMGKI